LKALIHLLAVALLALACGPAVAEPCDDAIHPVPAPPAMAAISQDMAVGSGDTWFFPPTTGTLSQGVHWDGKQYFMKLGIWTTMSRPPVVTVTRRDGTLGSASFSPTSAGLPGPLPTSLMFPSVGCWDVKAEGATGIATAVIKVDPSIPTDRPR